MRSRPENGPFLARQRATQPVYYKSNPVEHIMEDELHHLSRTLVNAVLVSHSFLLFLEPQ
jgi:hypothetical protein